MDRDAHLYTPKQISIHSLRMEGDYQVLVLFCRQFHFNPLPPYGGRLKNEFSNFCVKHFNPLPPYGGRLCYVTNYSTADAISIHSLRMEGDMRIAFCFLECGHFNPLPPYGGRPFRIFLRILQKHFNPLPPYGGRPCAQPKTARAVQDFNPLPPYGGRQQNCTGKRFSFRLSLYNPAKKDAKDYILHPKK